jgi:hypothetical protein
VWRIQTPVIASAAGTVYNLEEAPHDAGVRATESVRGAIIDREPPRRVKEP